jgi:hypothetical protein
MTPFVENAVERSLLSPTALTRRHTVGVRSRGLWLRATAPWTLHTMTPITTSFDVRSTAAEVANGIGLSGKRAIVTGGLGHRRGNSASLASGIDGAR